MIQRIINNNTILLTIFIRDCYCWLNHIRFLLSFRFLGLIKRLKPWNCLENSEKNIQGKTNRLGLIGTEKSKKNQPRKLDPWSGGDGIHV